MIDLEGFILAGGSSSRMGKRKDRLTIGDRSFLSRAADSLISVAGGRVTVIGSPDIDECRQLGVQVISDADIDGKVASKRRGSVRGLYTALLNSNSAWLAVIACDLPFVASALLERLSEFCTNHWDAVVPVQPDGRLQPLCAFYRRENCLPHVEQFLTCDNWSLNAFLDRLNVRRVGFEKLADLPGSERFFINVNTPDDYERACGPIR
jgi:molybdopterin-guanine dinucleotide biosynthesis protein A